ncbi:Eaa1 [Stappia sp. 22II-S9-Z10]|nr:Eaa1 [Stappia sp. 22II-S9-Z10]
MGVTVEEVQRETAVLEAARADFAKSPGYHTALAVQIHKRNRDALRRELPPLRLIEGGQKVTSFEDHLTRQIAFSRATFGPGKRTAGVIDHIRKELVEIEQSDGSPDEWVDVVILALDGLTRATKNAFAYSERSAVGAAEAAVRLILRKQSENELRDRPDWRTAPADKAIEHVRNGEMSANDARVSAADMPWYPDDSGEWVEHDGGPCRVHDEAIVEVLLRGERDDKDYVRCFNSAETYEWIHHRVGRPCNIVAYKVVRPAPAEKHWYPDDSGEWIEHTGDECPVPGNTPVQVLLGYSREDHTFPRNSGFVAADWEWSRDIEYRSRIVAYRVIKAPKA